MALSYLFPEKKSPIEGIPVIPGGTFYSGHLHLLRESNFEKALYKWAVEHADDDGRCTFWMGPNTPCLCVTHCEDVEMLLKASAYRSFPALLNGHFQHLFGNQNVGLLNGRNWKKQRARITKAMHTSAVIKHHESAFHQTALHLVEKIYQQIDKSENKVWQCENILDLMKALTMDCFGQAAFHSNFGTCQKIFNMSAEMIAAGSTQNSDSDASDIGPAFDALTSDIMRRVTRDVMLPSSHMYTLPTATNQTYKREREKVISFLKRLINERYQLMQQQAAGKEMKSTIPTDLLSGFLEHFQASSSESGTKDTDAPLKEEDFSETISQSIMALLFAGYETSSVTLTYCLYLLSQHPTVLDKCLKEIRSHSKDDTTATATEMPSFVYLEAVLKETLRLYPPAISTNRSTERDLELPLHPKSRSKDSGSCSTKKIVIPKGTYLYFPIWTIQRDPLHFHDPLDFLPERWVSYDCVNQRWRMRNDDDDNDDNDNDDDDKTEKTENNGNKQHENKAWIPFSMAHWSGIGIPKTNAIALEVSYTHTHT